MRRSQVLVVGLVVAVLTALGAIIALAAGGRLLSQATPGILGAAEDGDFLAADVASGDFDGDGYDDVIAGVPFEDVGSVTDGGAVQVVYGAASGLTGAGDQVLHAGSRRVAGALEADDLLGYSVAVGDFDADGYDDAAIGSPGEDVGATVDAGGVLVLYGSGRGLRGRGSQALSQSSVGLRGAAEAHDEFGQSLATGDFDGDGYDDVAVGIPGEAIGDRASAGAVQILFGSASGITGSGDQVLSQNTSGVSERAEVGDLFGWALASADFNDDGHDDLAVGVPGEGLGSNTPSAGIVQAFSGSADGIDPATGRVLSQSTDGVAGAAEADDGFGASVAAGDANGDGFGDLAIGAPGEAIGSKLAGGTASILYGSSDGVEATGSRSLTQAAAGVRGTAEAGDEFGLEVGLVDVDGDGRDDLVVAAPGEGIGSANGAGAVHVFYGRVSGITVAGDELLRQGSSGVAGRVQPNGGFGRSVTSGDVDGDGRDELIVGSPGAAAGSRDGSGAFVVIAG